MVNSLPFFQKADNPGLTGYCVYLFHNVLSFNGPGERIRVDLTRSSSFYGTSVYDLETFFPVESKR